MSLYWHHYGTPRYSHSDIELLNNFSVNISLRIFFINNFFIDRINLSFNFILDWEILLSRSNCWDVFNFHFNIQLSFFLSKINFIDWSSIQTFWFKCFTEFSFFMSNILITLKILKSRFTRCRSMNWCRSFQFNMNAFLFLFFKLGLIWKWVLRIKLNRMIVHVNHLRKFILFRSFIWIVVF